MSRGSVSIDVWTEVSIDVGWNMLVDRRWVSSVDGGEWVSVDETRVWVDGGWRKSSNEQVLLSIDEERTSCGLNAPSLQDLMRITAEFPCCFWYCWACTWKTKKKKFVSESGFKLNKIKSNRWSKLPGNGAKFDITQITLRSELLSQIKGSDVVLRDQIHEELRNLINLIRFVKVVCLMFLM